MMRHRINLAAVAALLATGASAAIADNGAELVAVKDLAANTVARIATDATGGRNSPAFFYDPELKRFILTGGTPGGSYGNAKRHFDAEQFDPETRRWINTYPEGSPYTVESGVTDAPEKVDFKTLADANGVSRIPMFTSAYGVGTRAHRQWAYDTDAKKLYAYIHNRTLVYEPARRTWSDTGAEPFTRGRYPTIWGSMCYDPVNKELLWIGGTSSVPGGSPGTHVYDPAKNQWRHLEFGSEPFNDLRGQIEQFRPVAWALVSACRNRFHSAETDAESKADLTRRGQDLARRLSSLEMRMQRVDGLKPYEAAYVERARNLLKDAAVQFNILAENVGKGVTPVAVAHAEGSYRLIESACYALAVEPAPRGNSQMVYDASTKKIVLFGGDRLDAHFADTWVYDCQLRKWEQRFPLHGPTPRAGHALVYLPRHRKVLLLGGYGLDGNYRTLPFQAWLYDTAADVWTVLLEQPAAPRGAPANAPAGSPRSLWLAATGPDDLVVMLDSGTTGRHTWAMKVDPSAADPARTVELGVKDDSPRAMTFAIPPISFERNEKVQPDPAAVADAYAKLPANTWQLFVPPVAPVRRDWGTTAYDPDRRQFLWWGGGHVTYMGTDVAHYSVRGNTWSLSYHPALPLEWGGGFSVKADSDFMDRPQIAVHNYQAYCYDPPSGLMVAVHGRAYDVAARQWRPERIEIPFRGGVMHTAFESTPRGAVAWSEDGLFRFDARKMAFDKLPIDGPMTPRPWCDGSGMCYDSKRDCLWLSARGEISRYDLATGKMTRLDIRPPAELGEFALWREQVYLPDADLILLMRRFQISGRQVNVVFDPAAQKYFAAEIPFSDGGEHKFSWSSALRYDPALKVALLHAGANDGRVWAIRPDRAALKLTDLPPRDAPRP